MKISAGVGRTGTFIAMFNLILVLKKMLPIINKLKIKSYFLNQVLKIIIKKIKRPFDGRKIKKL